MRSALYGPNTAVDIITRGKRMHLKTVEMENFKSFGGKVTVPLMEGYTAITGPNGSGKSNITD
ncbi:MAG: AAA family ATPase, partial [Candidatus Methanomethylophilaceae archaeon]|nr:AAA family ATPase [Candidatus Methanomethylophilaceae archaeon]